jgi:uncharacterized protein
MSNKKVRPSGEIIKILKKNHATLTKMFKTREIGVFGSYVKGEQKKSSDIDILVEFKQGYKTFDNYMELKYYLEEILGAKVDLVIKTAIRNEIKDNILLETIYV